MQLIYFILSVALICVLAVVLPILYLCRLLFLAGAFLLKKMTGQETGKYIVEVFIPTGPDSFSWFQQGAPRETLDSARAALEATRRVDNYGRFPMRIRVGDYPLIVVSPGDPPWEGLIR